MKLNQELQTLKPNQIGDDYVVGDIHGHVTPLLEQLSELGFDQKTDRLICVGDLIDRGPESVQALKLLDEPWFYSVIGNHEHLMLASLKYHDSQLRLTWLSNGGSWIMESTSADWPRWLEKIESLPLGIEVTSRSGVRYGIVHADYPRLDWSEFPDLKEEEALRAIWAREPFQRRYKNKVKNIDWVIHGHNVTDSELTLGNRIYIEPGAYLGNDFIIKKLE